MPLVGTLVLLFTASLILVATGCNEKAVGKSGLTQSTGQVLANIGQQAITDDDLEAAMRRIPERKREALRPKVLDSLIEARVFAMEAVKAGLDQDPKVKEGMAKATNETLAFYFVKKQVDPEDNNQ